MAKNKTTETSDSVTGFLSGVADDTKRADSLGLVQLLSAQTGLEPRMWGPNIVGFGSYHYQYASGHAGDAPLVAFSPRANALVLYLAADFPGREALLQQLGKHKSGKSCIYLKKLADVNQEVLKEMVTESVKHIKEVYP